MIWLERNQGARQLKSDGLHEKDKGNEDRIEPSLNISCGDRRRMHKRLRSLTTWCNITVVTSREYSPI